MLQKRNTTINTRIQLIKCDVKLTGICKLQHLKNRTIGNTVRIHTIRQCQGRRLALTVPDLGTHAALLATNFSPTLTRLLRSHEPVISEIQTEYRFGRGEE